MWPAVIVAAVATLGVAALWWLGLALTWPGRGGKGE